MEINVRKVRDLGEPGLEIYTALKENQLAHLMEPEPGLFVAESPQVIGMALEAGYEPRSLLLEEGIPETAMRGILDEIRKIPTAAGEDRTGSLPLYLASHGELRKITGYELTGGALAAFRRKKLPEPAEILKNAKRVAVTEGVMNPRNIGSIFRNAAALGFDAVLLTGGSSDPLYRRAARVSMGTVFRIPWTFSEDIGVLKELGFATAAMALREDSCSLSDAALKNCEKLAVLLGSERSGLRPETLEKCDFTVMIPMYHGTDSLNVAAASAVAFWELGPGKREGSGRHQG